MINDYKILLIEDDLDDAFIIKKIISDTKDLDYKIFHAKSLAEGLELLKDGSYSIILLDLNLPDSNTINTYYEIKKLYPDYPVIILTGLDDDVMALHAIKEGAMDYIPKHELSKDNLKRIISYAIERKKLKQELEEKNSLLFNTTNELEKKNEELKKLTYTITNDLVSPILTLVNSTEEIYDFLEVKNYNDIKPRLDKIYNSAQNMHSLINKLIDILKIGFINLKVTNFSLVEAFNEALEKVSEKYDTTNTEIIIEDNIPDNYADKTRVVQIMYNLLDNSFKYMGNNENPQITFGVKRFNNKIVYFIHDNGIGIDASFHNLIFDFFFKIDQQTSGKGLGLAFCKKVIDEHYGKIWVESDGEGKGCTFYFTINDLENTLK